MTAQVVPPTSVGALPYFISFCFFRQVSSSSSSSSSEKVLDSAKDGGETPFLDFYHPYKTNRARARANHAAILRCLVGEHRKAQYYQAPSIPKDLMLPWSAFETN